VNKEDKQFYTLQLSSNGEAGYSTEKEAPKGSIHPSKRRLQFQPFCQPSTSSVVSTNITETLSSQSSSEESSHYEDYNNKKQKRQRQSTKSAVKLVTKGNLSTNKASKILNILNEQGHDVPIPSQSGVYKAVYKEA